MPVAKALSFASCFALTIQFLIFAYLYSSHRVRFFRYLVVAWGLMSLAKGLHLAETLVPGQDIAGALINAVFFGATLLVLAAGLAFRSGYRIGWRDLLLGERARWSRRASGTSPMPGSPRGASPGSPPARL